MLLFELDSQQKRSISSIMDYLICSMNIEISIWRDSNSRKKDYELYYSSYKKDDSKYKVS